MGTRFAVLALVAALCGTVALSSLAPAAAAQTATPGLTLSNVTGTLTRGGQFAGAVTITRLTNRAGTLVADGIVTGSTIPASGLEPPLPSSLQFTASITPTSPSTPVIQPTSIFDSTFTATPETASTATSTPQATATFEPASSATLTPQATPTSTTAPVSVSDSMTAAALAGPAAQSTSVMQSFREIPLTLTDPDSGACDTLSVDLSTIFLDQLGVQLDLAPATVDLGTLPRANRPLGNLLCAVASIVEVSPGGSQAALLNELLPVVNRALSSGAR
jgi:hypothetical protein